MYIFNELSFNNSINFFLWYLFTTVEKKKVCQESFKKYFLYAQNN